MTNPRTIKNRMEFIRQQARGANGGKHGWPLGWRGIHNAAIRLEVELKPVQWQLHHFFPDLHTKADVDGLSVSIDPLWAGGFRWCIVGERKLVGDCDSMTEAKRAVEKAIAFLTREAQE